MVPPVVRSAQRHRHERHAVPLRRGDKTSSAPLRIPGLDADRAVVEPEHLVVIQEIPRLVADGYIVPVGRDYLTEPRVRQSVNGKLREVARRRVMLLVIKPVRICEMRVFEPYLLRFRVHQLGEGVDRARDIYRYSRGGVVRALEHQRPDEVVKAELVPRLKIYRRTLDPDSAARNGHLTRGVPRLEGDERGHYLRRARHRASCVGVLLEDDVPARRLDHYRRLRADTRADILRENSAREKADSHDRRPRA